MNNAIFCKTMENLQTRVNVKVETNPNKFHNLTAPPSFDAFRFFSEGLATICVKKDQVVPDISLQNNFLRLK